MGWGCPGLQMVDLSERENRLSGRERGDRANTEYPCFNVIPKYTVKTKNRFKEVLSF